MKYLFALFFIFTNTNAIANKIVYGFSSGILPSETQEFVFRGFLMGLKKYNKINPDNDLKMVYSNSGSLLSPISVAKDVVTYSPQIITGFPSSFESQLAAPILKKSNIVTVFASSSNLELANMGPTIYSSAENIIDANKEITKLILSKYKNVKGTVIYNPSDYFSINQLTTWKQIRNENKDLILEFIPTSPDGKIPTTNLESLKSYGFIITTLFPSKSYDLFRFLDEHKIDLPVYTNSSWYKMDYSLLKRFFLRKKEPVFAVQFKNYNQNISNQIAKDYAKRYKSPVTPEVIVGYDLGVIVGGILQKSLESNIDPLAIMKNRPCFEGSPFGDVCFNGQGGFSPREVTLKNINENI